MCLFGLEVADCWLLSFRVEVFVGAGAPAERIRVWILPVVTLAFGWLFGLQLLLLIVLSHASSFACSFALPSWSAFCSCVYLCACRLLAPLPALLFFPLCLLFVLLPACPFACLCGLWVGFEGLESLGFGPLGFRAFGYNVWGLLV